ncbi:flavodoxin [uncultured Victivallis sp.]|uniref:flavodoxin n=1 Tax=uncultured Victivallis sp. TaxID=354118 RepID=UPI0025CFAD18|nr:flavodoxin [uncultured Victivallis sp.]
MIGKTMVCMMAGAMFSMSGCSAEDGSPAAKVTAEPAKVLIAYYSWSGNTRAAAEQIQKITGGTLFEIKPAKAYPSDYSACVDQAKQECRDEFKPELATKVEDFAKYDVIFVGTPNWWSTMAPPVRSFLAGYDFSGKTVIPFVTHGGGGMARCERDMRKVCPKAAFGKGGAFSGGSIRNAADALRKWVDEVVTIRK